MFDKKILADIDRASLLQCLFFLLAMSLFFALSSPAFITSVNLVNILTAITVIGLIAVGVTFVIGSGAIDLSGAANMGLSSVVCAWTVQNLHVTGIGAIGVAIATGGIGGLATGLLINITRAPSFIITLGMLSIFRALALLLTNGIPIYGLDERVIRIAEIQVFGVSFSALTLLGGVLLGYLLLTRTQFGAHTLLVGDNPTAAEEMGVRVWRVRLLTFILAGCLSGMAGFIFMARTNSGDPAAGMNYELLAITAVALGGANLFGGRATMLGTLAGILCLGVLQNGLNLMAMSTFYQTLFGGMVLILASFLRRLSSQQ